MKRASLLQSFEREKNELLSFPPRAVLLKCGDELADEMAIHSLEI
jgi:hypothetical protein